MDRIAYKPLVLDPTENELHGLDLGQPNVVERNPNSDLSSSELPDGGDDDNDDDDDDDDDDADYNDDHDDDRFHYDDDDDEFDCKTGASQRRGRFFSRNSHRSAQYHWNNKGDMFSATTRLVLACLAAAVTLVILLKVLTLNEPEKQHPVASFASLKSAALPNNQVQISTTQGQQQQQQQQLNLVTNQLTNNGGDSSQSGRSTKPTRATLRVNVNNNIDNPRPFYDSYLTSVISESNFDPLDDLSLPHDQLYSASETFQKQAKTSPWWTTKQRGNYATISKYIRAMKSFDHNKSVTLTTQASIGFLHHAIELCKRWDGPISVAVFAPVQSAAVTLIKFMRQCLPIPISACIRDKISWHLVYPMQQQQGNSLNANVEPDYPRNWLDTQDYPLFSLHNQCPKFAGPEPADMVRQFETNLEKLTSTTIAGAGPSQPAATIVYPINVLRNTARLAAPTKYVLASDIELYPSVNLVPMFIDFVTKHNITHEFNNIRKYIFTLPIFETKSNVKPPKDKRELVKLHKKGDAVFFHKYVCDACQSFPNRSNWLQTDQIDDSLSSVSGSVDDELQIFAMTIRDRARDQWEPIFIGTNQEPLYDDRLTWDGRRDKMGQMVEMCLAGYHLLVLDNAFLVHAPGIKRIDRSDNERRFKFMIENNAIYTSYIAELRKRYAKSDRIDIC